MAEQSPLPIRRMGTCGPEATVLGVGTMSWPGCRYGEGSTVPHPVEEAVRILETTLECGIRLVDTAESYGRGVAEETLGEAIERMGAREEFVIVTKTGPLFGGERSCNLSREHLLTRTDAALERLRTDRIDVLLAHWPDPLTPIEETMQAASELQSSGKIAAFGVSNFPPDLLGRALACGPVACNQLPYSLADRSIESGAMAACVRGGVGIMAYSPLGKGILGGRYSHEHLPPSGDYRHQRPHFREHLDRNLALAARVKEIANAFSAPPAAVALGWVLARQDITCAIPGVKSPMQVRELAKVASLLSLQEFHIQIATLD